MDKSPSKTSKPVGPKRGVAHYPGYMPYNPRFKKDNKITQQTGDSDVPISEPLMDIVSPVGREDLQQGYSVVARPEEKMWNSDYVDTSRKGPWRPKGASAKYRKNSIKSINRKDRGPGGTNGY